MYNNTGGLSATMSDKEHLCDYIQHLYTGYMLFHSLWIDVANSFLIALLSTTAFGPNLSIVILVLIFDAESLYVVSC